MKAMILAAGQGTRLQPLTLSTPKPLVEVAGKPLIEYHLEKLEAAGFSEVVVNVSWLAEKIEDYLTRHYSGNLKVIISQEVEALETGGGVFSMLSTLSNDNSPFLVINADVLTDFDFSLIPKKIDALAHLYLIDNPLHNEGGDFKLLENGSLGLKQSPVEGTLLTFSGVSILTPQLFAGCCAGKFSLGDLFRRYIASGDITGQRFSGNWFDVGTLERLEQAQAYLQAQ